MAGRGNDIEQFESRLRSLRRAGAIYFHVGPAAPDWQQTKPFTDAIDVVGQSIGLRGIGSGFGGWRELAKAEARDNLVELLRLDLTYRVELMSEKAAGELADAFLGFFVPGTLYFSNRRPDGSWMPLTDATFDTGVVALSGSRCGILWAADED